MSAFSSLFGGAKVDKDVDQLLKSSAGPLSRPNKVRTEVVLPEVIESPETPSQEVPHTKEKKIKRRKKTEAEPDYEGEYYSKVLSEPASETEAKPEEDEAKPKEDEAKPKEDEAKPQEEAATATPKEKSAGKAKVVDLKEDELRKAERTVFVGNVSNKAITSKSVYKEFKKIFSNHGKVESIRFRSISFKDSLPRKAAFIQKSLLDTRDTVNAYVVFKEAEPSLKCVSRLNGSVFDHNHIRVDHLAHPAPKDNKRTIFVGNLDFEEKEERLWRYFNEKVDDDVESVRVVRDSKTNFGKGFALVQFKDSTSVNKALLLNDKPMVNAEDAKKTRNLRISRAKATAKPSILSPNHYNNEKKVRQARPQILSDEQKTKIGRAKKLLGQSDKKTVGTFVAEGTRASKGQKIEGVKGLKTAQGRVKKPRITQRSKQFKTDKKAFQKLA